MNIYGENKQDLVFPRQQLSFSCDFPPSPHVPQSHRHSSRGTEPSSPATSPAWPQSENGVWEREQVKLPKAHNWETA